MVVQVYDAPLSNPEVSDDVELAAPATVDLTATGENVRWFDWPTEGILLHEGNDFSPEVTSTTTFWAEDSRITQGESHQGGEMSYQETGAYHPNGARWLEFDVHEALRLNSVTLYAEGTYERSFELINAFGMVLESTTVLVEDGTFVLDLNWDIEPGEGYGLRCVSEEPQLWREGTDSDLNYPYEVGDLLTITNSTAGPSLDYYYFFYQWVAEEKPIECASERVGVTVTVNGTSDLQDLDEASWRVTPNPVAQGALLSMPGLPAGTVVNVLDNQGRIVHSGTWTGTLSVEWPAGWYAVRAFHAHGIENRTVVVR